MFTLNSLHYWNVSQNVAWHKAKKINREREIDRERGSSRYTKTASIAIEVNKYSDSTVNNEIHEIFFYIKYWMNYTNERISIEHGEQF